MYTTHIRYGKLFTVTKCKSDTNDYRLNEECVIRTDRGTEIGKILKPFAQMNEKERNMKMVKIIRKMNSEDREIYSKIKTEEHAKLQFCRKQSKELKLPMRLSGVEQIFGGDKLVFYFTAENRVDFRGLVKILAKEYKTRIELKQLGARDEAKLSGDTGHCGQRLCCGAFLTELGGSTISMAKKQNRNSKNVGMCGKLLCCLRYEYSAYKDVSTKKEPKPLVK